MILPSVRNLKEATEQAFDFPAVITAGPSRHEVAWNHSNHHIEVFDDIYTGSYAPTLENVQQMLHFAAMNDGPILVHCHAGVSRSTATAIGIAIQRGFDPHQAVDLLELAQPFKESQPSVRRQFYPNLMILEILEYLLPCPGLVAYAYPKLEFDEWGVVYGDDDEDEYEYTPYDPWEEEVREDDYTGKVSSW